jgi:hypothetical protein
MPGKASNTRIVAFPSRHDSVEPLSSLRKFRSCNDRSYLRAMGSSSQPNLNAFRHIARFFFPLSNTICYSTVGASTSC